MSRVHVLHIVPMLHAGGMETALSRIANGLLSAGMTHTVVSLKDQAVIKDMFDPSIRIQALHADANDPLVPLRIRRLLVEERPTVIHARNFGAWPEVALARMTVAPPIPFIFSFHGVSDPAPPPLRWRLTMRLLIHLTTYVYAVSHGAKSYLTEKAGLPSRLIDVIPNGVDTSRFSPGPKSSVSPRGVIGTLGNLMPIKNQALLIKAGHRLLQSGIDLTLQIAGDGPLRPELEGLIASLGVGDRVHLIGRVSDTPAFLRSLDVFVLPSNSEAHPNALSEAMACGLPCIGSRVGGIPEILDNGRAGLLFDAGDVEQLAGAMQSLLADPQRRQALGSAAREFTCEHYSFPRMLERYRQLYQQVSSGSSGKAYARPIG